MRQRSLSIISLTYRKAGEKIWSLARLIAWLCLALAPGLAGSVARPTISVVGGNRNHWTSASGFNGGYVYSITQTKDGYLWIGTSNGLIRFDGVNFHDIPVDPSESLANPSIISVASDSDGRLWTSNGLQMLQLVDGHLKEGLPSRGRQPNQDVLISEGLNGGILYAAGVEGISAYDRGESRLLVKAGEVPSIPTALTETSNGTLWMGTRTGLFVVEQRAGLRAVHRVAGLPDTTVVCLLPFDQTELLIGTNKGLWIWNGNAIKRTGIQPEVGDRSISALARDLDGNIWIGTESGVLKTAPNSLRQTTFRPVEKMADSMRVTALYEDREGNMWAGAADRIERYRGSAFTTYSFSGDVPSENGGPVYVDEESRTWFAPSVGGLFWFRRNEVQAVDCAGMKADGVYSLAGGNGEVWVGRKRGGLTEVRAHGTSFECLTYTERNGMAQNGVYSLYRGPDGTVWAGTLNKGLSQLRRGRIKNFTANDGLPSNSISAIAGSSSGGIFVGTPNGLGELRGDHWIIYTAREGLPPGAIDSLFTDSTGTLWIGTTKGIAFLHDGVIQVNGKVPDPLSEDILGIAEANGWLWIATPDRVLRVRRDPLKKGILEENDYREYGAAEGLASVEGVKRNRSVVQDQLGQVWFSLNRGISVMQPPILARQSIPPLIHLERMVADEREVPLRDGIRLASGRHRLTFHFASVSLTNPDQIRYRYRLDDYDSSWSEPGPINEANYTNVPPGNFRFRVMARSADGIWCVHEAAVRFAVEPEYWQTRWFQLASFGAFCLLGGVLYRLRLVHLTRRLNFRFEERLAERARIGRELHDTLLQNLTGLSLQISGIAKIVKEPPRAAEGLKQLKRQAEDCVRETRQSVWDIRSVDAEIQDLPNALEHSGQQLTAGKGVQFRFVCEGEPRELPSQVRHDLLRIAREAIGNAVRHASATEIQLILKFRSRDCQLTVSDDGRGFELAEKDELPGHFGLTTMKERAQQMRASIHITSSIGRGTLITVRVPWKGGKL